MQFINKGVQPSSRLQCSEIVLGRDIAFEIVGADIVEDVKDVFGMNAGDRITLIVKIVPLK